METVVVPMSWLLWVMLWWIWECRCLSEIVISFPSQVYPKVGLLDHVVVLFFIFWGNSILFSPVAVPRLHSHWLHKGSLFSIYPHQHLLFLIFLIIGTLIDLSWYLTVVLICISLMTSDVEHLFMYLLAICIFFLKKCQVLCPFLNWTVWFLCCWVVWDPYMFLFFGSLLYFIFGSLLYPYIYFLYILLVMFKKWEWVLTFDHMIFFFF